MKTFGFKGTSGFTLIEILVVVTILAVLASIAIPRFITYRLTSQQNTCLANLSMLNQATDAYLANKGLPANADVTLDMLAPDDVSKINGDYFIRYKPVCPSGGTYSYDCGKQTWRCSLGGGSDANDGFPHGEGAE